MKLSTISYVILLLLVTLSKAAYSINAIYHYSNKFNHTKNQAIGSGGNPVATLSGEITLNSDCAFLSSSSVDQTITITGAIGNEFTVISMINLPASANAKFLYTALPNLYMQIKNGESFYTFSESGFIIPFEIPMPTG